MQYRLLQFVVLFVLVFGSFTVPNRMDAQIARMIASSAAVPELSGKVMREVVDPCLGQRWQWVADPLHPQRPYRLLLAGATRDGATTDSAVSAREEHSLQAVRAIVIHSGDRVTVYQETGTIRARFQAIALEPASMGQSLRVRLAISDRHQGANFVLTSFGPAITVTVTGSGEAAWIEASNEPITREHIREQSR